MEKGEEAGPTQNKRRHRGRPELYDWKTWFSQPEFRVMAGRDYLCSQTSMAQQIRGEASDRGLFVRISDINIGLVVRVSQMPFRTNGRRRSKKKSRADT
jgi:hypothetical protein